MFLGMRFDSDSRLAKSLTVRLGACWSSTQNTLDRCSVFAENPQVLMTGRHGDDMSPCSADVRKAVPLPWTSQGMLYGIQSIKIKRLYEHIFGEHLNCCSCLQHITWVSNGKV
jgi:hypothetical protein